MLALSAGALTHIPGASGTGRTTFVNTLVEQPLLDHRSQSLLSDPSNPHSEPDHSLVRQAAENAHVEVPIRIKPINVELDEDGVRIALTIVDTPGFGDGVDNEYWWVPNSPLIVRTRIGRLEERCRPVVCDR